MSFEDGSQHLHDGFQTAKTYIQNTPGWLYEGFQNAKALTTVTVGSIILAKVLDPDLGVVTAGSSLVKQAEFAFPSIIPDAPIAGEPYDLGIDVAFTTGTLAVAGQELNNGHTTKKGLLGTATLAQVLASGWDAIADRTWLNPAEKKLPDDGDSSVLGGILTKAALDHFWAARQNEEFGTGKKLLVGAGLGTVALMSTVGALASEGSQGGKLDMISHAAGITAGVIAHFVGRILKGRKQKRETEHEAAAHSGLMAKPLTQKAIEANQKHRIEEIRKGLAVLSNVSANFEEERKLHGWPKISSSNYSTDHSGH